MKRGLRDYLEVKSICCSWRGTIFISEDTHYDSQGYLTPDSREPTTPRYILWGRTYFNKSKREEDPWIWFNLLDAMKLILALDINKYKTTKMSKYLVVNKKKTREEEIKLFTI